MSSIPPASFDRPSPTEQRRLDQDAVVVCSQVTKIFKDFWVRDYARAVQGLSFDIRRREVFGLLGPNGSGKSTTIKMILGLLRPTSGRISVLGKLPNDVEIKRRIGYLPEESYLYGFLNARETLDYYGKLFEIDHRTRQRRIVELLDMLGLTGAAYRPVREYSKGMQRRIGIAQALINDPDFLILDEPTTGLDPLGTRQIKDLIIELGRRGKTILLSSHLLADVEECVDRLVILYGGTKRAEGTCDELLESRERTTIEADALDEPTIAEIDKVVRSRSNGERSVRKVSRPRQSLEALFLDIVEKAKSEQVTTSGATSGGGTASFLKAQQEQGQELVDKLLVNTDATSVDTRARDAAEEAKRAAAAERDLIEGLVSEKPAANAMKEATSTRIEPATTTKAPPAPKDVDKSVIDALLGGSDLGGGAGGGRGSGGEPKP
jgi:ABC-2 type transport system ATP-binding protein